MRKHITFLIIFTLLVVYSGIPSALAADTIITTQVISGGATNTSGDGYVLKGTIRQTAIRRSIGDGLVLGHGFWPYFQWCCIGIRGNVDGDPNEEVNIADMSFLVDYLFKGGPEPSCREEGNVDGDQNDEINVADLTYLLDFLFKGGPPPPSC